jgi:hypothetical protein
VTLFNRGTSHLRLVGVAAMTPDDGAVREALELLGIAAA